MAAAHVEVCGMVQGVGFRWFTVQAARRLGIAGWVRNRADGCVEISASGEAVELARFLEEVRRGPEGARIDSVRDLPVGESDPVGREFRVVR
jgi:acylphosphatase